MPYVNPTLAINVVNNASIDPKTNPTLYKQQQYLYSQIISAQSAVTNPTKENLNAINDLIIKSLQHNSSNTVLQQQEIKLKEEIYN